MKNIPPIKNTKKVFITIINRLIMILTLLASIWFLIWLGGRGVIGFMLGIIFGVIFMVFFVFSKNEFLSGMLFYTAQLMGEKKNEGKKVKTKKHKGNKRKHKGDD